jgi:hypothetical protein
MSNNPLVDIAVMCGSLYVLNLSLSILNNGALSRPSLGALQNVLIGVNTIMVISTVFAVHQVYKSLE